MSVLEELKKKISDIETQSLAMDGCRPTFTVSEIMDLIDSVEADKQTAGSAQPNLQPTCNQLATDTVYRQAAIDPTYIETPSTNGDCISRQSAIHLITGYVGIVDKSVAKRLLMQMPPAQPDEKLRKITDLVEGSIDHFDRDDAMDLLYQIKEIVGNETSNI